MLSNQLTITQTYVSGGFAMVLWFKRCASKNAPTYARLCCEEGEEVVVVAAVVAMMVGVEIKDLNSQGSESRDCS